MAKLLKLLLILDGSMVLLTLLIYIPAAHSSDGFGGILAFFPLTAAIFLTIAIIVLLFASALQRTASPVGTKDVNAIQFTERAVALLGVPALGIYYATHGQNRHGLLVVSVIGLLLGTAAMITLIIRRR